MTGRTFKRCGCRDEAGKQLGANCTQLKAKGHGSWSYVVDQPGTDGDRRQHMRGGFRTKADAERARDEYVGLSRAGHRIDDRLFVGDYLDAWLANKTDTSGISSAGRQVSPGTAALYRQHIGLLTPLIGRIRLALLRDDDIATAYRRIAADRGVGAATQNRIHGTLRAALNAAVKKRLIPYNPALGVELAPERRAPVRPWEPAELGQFLDSVTEHRMGTLFETIAYLGLRRGEALGLRWSDVDLDRGTITINQTWRGRYSPDGQPLFDPPKTEGRRSQRLDLPADVQRALEVQRLRQDLERSEWRQGYRDHDLVFAGEDGWPVSPAHVSRTFGDLASRAGLRHVRVHDLRHGAASLMLASGTSLEMASKVLGHSSIGITSKTYSHLLEGVQREASNRAAGLVPRSGSDVSVSTS